MNESLARIRAMNKSELIEKIAKRFPTLTREDTDAAVNLLLNAIAQQLANGGRIEVRGFGSFKLSYRPERNSRNPKTGERLLVPAKCVPHFTVGKEMRELVDFKP